MTTFVGVHDHGTWDSPHLSTEQLRDWLENKLPPERETKVESHLECCDTCAEVLEKLDPPLAPLIERMRELNVDFPLAGNDRQRYDLGDEIARGGMGVVLRAFDNNIRRDVAIKVLREDGQDSAEIVRRFHQEAQIGGQLQHPGIAPVYEIGRLPDGRRFIAMKLVKGKTLADLLASSQDAAGDQAKFLGIFEQICQAMAFAHTRDVIHRDLKPANVMVGEFGEVQVMDWGLAKLLDEKQPAPARSEASAATAVVESATVDVDTGNSPHHTRMGQAMGTPAYMPPEQHQGQADKTADVFALGGILYEILTGELASGDLDVAGEQLDRCYCDQQLVQLAKDCLQRKPADRPPDAGAVATRISSHLNAIQTRLKEAEIATARANVRAEEERKRRQTTLWTVAAAATLLVIAGLSSWGIRNTVIERQNTAHARGLVDALPLADTARVPTLVEGMRLHREWTDPMLRQRFNQSKPGSTERLHAALALAPVDASKRDFLQEQLHQVTPRQFSVLRDTLRPYRDKIIDSLWPMASGEQHSAEARFRAAACLAEFAPSDERWNEIATFVAQHLTGTVSSTDFGYWLLYFQPASHQIVNELTAIHANRENPATHLKAAALALAEYCRREPDKLANVVLAADTSAEFKPLIASLRPHAATAKPLLIDQMRAKIAGQPDPQQRETHWQRQAIAAVALVQLGYGDKVWPLLKFTANPSIRSYVIEFLGQLDTDHNILFARLRQEDDVSIRRALIQALGGLDQERIPVADREGIAAWMAQSYTSDPDPGIHASASWALRRWKFPLPPMSEANRRVPSEILPVGEYRWFVNSQGQTMVAMSSMARRSNRTEQYNFAIASCELTASEFARFDDSHGKVPPELADRLRQDQRWAPDRPASSISWYAAAEYCNWLSARDGISEDQWVYEPGPDGKYSDGMKIKKNCLELRGYRLPTFREWRQACRCGTGSTYSFGDPVSLLDRYANTVLNSSGISKPVGQLLPNDAGLFDMHGNVLEWMLNAGKDAVTHHRLTVLSSPVRNDIRRLQCGGMFTDRPGNVRSAAEFAKRPDILDSIYGFRVARTIR